MSAPSFPARSRPLALAPDEAARLVALSLLAIFCLLPGIARLRTPDEPARIFTDCAAGAVRRAGRVACVEPGRPEQGARLSPVSELWLGRRLDLNQVDAATLSVVPGIGPRLAARIVDHREAHGPFARLEDVDEVHGIGPKLAARLARYAAVHPQRGP
jgi:competence ComEA-like helix-hairpin-helix protein